MKQHITVAIGLCLLGISPLRAETPSQFIEKIYSSKEPAIFSLNEKSLSLYTPELQKQMRAAIKLDEVFSKEHPGDKPPLADYVLLCPGPDQFSKVSVFTSLGDKSSKQQLVIVELRYPESPNRSYAHITLSPKNKTWQIADIRWDNEGKADSAILKNQLEALIRENAIAEVEQAGADQPATKPADKVPAKIEPSTPTSKDGPR